MAQPGPRERADGPESFLLRHDGSPWHSQRVFQKAVSSSSLSVIHTRRDRTIPDLVRTPTQQPTYLISVFLSERQALDNWRDDIYQPRIAAAAGTTQIYDLRDSWVSMVRGPFEAVNFLVPQIRLDLFTEELGVPAMLGLPHLLDIACHDPIMLHLAQSLVPVMATPDPIDTLFADHVFNAMILHVARKHGGVRLARGRQFGRLAPWQERRACEMLQAATQGGIALSELAQACGLSISHFARAFKASTGAPPHRWLREHRISLAKDLLAHSSLSCSEIALTCGFSDQSHLTRVFSEMVGATPGAWRRARRT